MNSCVTAFKEGKGSPSTRGSQTEAVGDEENLILRCRLLSRGSGCII